MKIMNIHDAVKFLEANGYHVQFCRSPERTEGIVKDHLSGMIGKDVGTKYGVTASSVRMITMKYCKKMNPSAFERYKFPYPEQDGIDGYGYRPNNVLPSIRELREHKDEFLT